jgi:hypothetical protein
MYKPPNKLMMRNLSHSDLFNAIHHVFKFNFLQVKNKMRGSYMLVCAPANAACDLLAQKLIPHCTTDELLRLHSSSRDWY